MVLFYQSCNQDNRHCQGGQITDNEEDDVLQRRLQLTSVGHLVKELGLAQAPTQEDDNQQASHGQQNVGSEEIEEIYLSILFVLPSGVKQGRLHRKHHPTPMQRPLFGNFLDLLEYSHCL